MADQGRPYWHIDAFADQLFSGNQAAVIELATWSSDGLLQAIAAENNFAETAFVVRDASGEADWELRWFTPASEIRLCGHATLASGHALLARDGGHTITFRTRKSGVMTVRHLAGASYELALPAIPILPSHLPDIARLVGGNPQVIARNSLGYNVLHYASASDILALKPDFAALSAMGDDQYICTAPGDNTDIVSRVFVPGAGVNEDSVTGSAHAVLTPYWAPLLGKNSFTAFQASARGGSLHCRLDGENVWLGGGCITVAEGRYFVCG